MKKGLLLMAAIAMLGAQSCNEVAKALDFGIPMLFEESYSIDIPDGSPKTFEEVMIVDASGNQEVIDNLDNIANFDLTKVAFKVTSFTGDDAITADAVVQFFNAEGDIGDPINMGTIAFRALADSGEETEIAVSNDLKNTLEAKLLNDQAFSMRLTGVVSGTPMKADLIVVVGVEAKVKF